MCRSRPEQSQNIIPPNEWPKFIQTLREPLPTTFRLAGSRELVTPGVLDAGHTLNLQSRTVHELNDIIRSTYVSQLSDVTFEGEKVSPPVQLTWSIYTVSRASCGLIPLQVPRRSGMAIRRP